MKQHLIILISAVFIIATMGSSMAEDRSHDHHDVGHGMETEDAAHEGHQMHASGHDAMDHSSHKGANIHNAAVEGYRFAYHLIDIREKMAAMKAAGHTHEGMDATHHLMVYIENPKGMTVEDAKVGYLVTAPDGSKQKQMGMGMGGGYGSDLDLADSGGYVIKTKAVTNGETLIDEFTYTDN